MTQHTQDAIDLLDADHRAVEALLDQFAQRSGPGAAAARHALAQRICLQVAIHMRLEEEVFYPEVREALGAAADPHDAEGEHAGVKELVGQVLALRLDDESYVASVAALERAIRQHVRHERESMFPEVRSSGIDLAGLAGRLRVRRQELEAVPEALCEDALASVHA